MLIHLIYPHRRGGGIPTDTEQEIVLLEKDRVGDDRKRQGRLRSEDRRGKHRHERHAQESRSQTALRNLGPINKRFAALATA